MTTYIEASLSKNEEIQELFNMHWFSYVSIVVWVLLVPFTVGITLVPAIWRYLELRTLEQGVTNKRVIYKCGIISRKTEEVKVSSIETVEMSQSVLGRIFGYGTLKITGHGISDVVFKGIDNPLSVKKSIESVQP